MRTALARSRLPLLLLLTGLAGSGCELQRTPPPLDPAIPAGGGEAPGPTGRTAWQHLEALTEIGPRVSGTPGAIEARDYIAGELRDLGLEVEEPWDPPGQSIVPEGLPNPRNVIGIVPGASEELVVLAAPYDSRHFEGFSFVGASDGGSGAAVLLELAAALRRQPLPYTTHFVFLDAEAGLEGAEGAGSEYALLGSQVQARRYAAQGLVPRIRVVVAFNRVCDVDLQIARDLMSHRMFREEFWQAAHRLGYDDAFPPDAPFETLAGSHLPFYRVGVKRVVAISDSAFGGDVAPGLYANTRDDDLAHCSEHSLRVVDEVSLLALQSLTARLAKIDRFAAPPPRNQSREPEEMPAPEEPAAAPAEPQGAGSAVEPAL